MVTAEKLQTAQHTHRFPRIWRPQDDEDLARCEGILLKGRQDAFTFNETLLHMREQKLYKKKAKILNQYCIDSLGMSRSTVAKKLQMARCYRNVRNCAHISPSCESQLRKLARKRNPEEQQSIWRLVVGLSERTKRPLTEQLVDEAIEAYTIKHGEYEKIRFVSDGRFSGISYRWELHTVHRDNETRKLMLKRIQLPDPKEMPPISELPLTDSASATKLVFVSPDCDGFTSEKAVSFLKCLAQVAAMMPHYRFMIWSKHLEIFGQVATCPANIEWGIRIDSQKQYDDSLQRIQQLSLHISTLWVSGRAPIVLSSPLPFTRAIISNLADPSVRENVQTFREMIAQLLYAGIPIHCEKTLLPVLAQGIG